MAEKIPVKAVLTGSDVTALGEFATTDTIPISNLASILTTAITDGDVTHAPNGNVVFDSLAAKASLTGTETLTNKTIMPTAVPAADYFSGVALGLIAHRSMTMGQVGFIDSSGEVDLADADASATMPVSVMCASAVATDATGTFLLPGSVIHLHSTTPAWTIGGLVYAGSGATTAHTAGAINQGVPTGSGDQVQVVGVALAADILLFNPSPVLVEIV